MGATAEDRRFYSGKLLEAVARGEEVIITLRGRPCAKLIPVEEEEGNRHGREIFGMWKDHIPSADLQGYVRRLRSGRFVNGQ